MIIRIRDFFLLFFFFILFILNYTFGNKGFNVFIYMDQTNSKILIIVKFSAIYTFMQFSICDCVTMFDNVLVYKL
jgi:hypothetical protein